MIHYSCDRCQRLIETEMELRYVVKIDVQTVLGDQVFANHEDDRDHLSEIHEMLEQHADQQESLVDDEVYQQRRYDLCCDCYKAYLRNPMGQEVKHSVDFSQN